MERMLFTVRRVWYVQSQPGGNSYSELRGCDL